MTEEKLKTGTICKGGAVRCDEPGCDWESTAADHDEVKQWHNKPCPRCGRGVIVNDEEMGVLNALVGIFGLFDSLFGSGELIDADAPHAVIRTEINTAHMRGSKREE